MTFRIPGRGRVATVTPGDGSVVIAPMRRRHVRQVAAIEERIFPRPWSPALYYSELAMPATRIYLVALAGDTVVGYAGLMLVAGDGHITTIGVAPEWQRKRIGMRLLHHLASAAREQGAAALTLEVRVSNHGAHELYRTVGFVPAGIRKNYYAEVNEDGLVMWAHGVDTEDYAMRLEEIAARLAGEGEAQ